ncbi:hypothetical protein CTAYLR_002794 [Chrysophaeum taylorii]|uniref:Proteasome subunit beta n=1 Tax=Chrysophaeum taylorii TaxID=2483200 RepID=A0AAD7U8Q9_9STRA|nr:hypothetical protein CTAYLR_002794 [Chrysophaeum taylorii]
MLFFFLLVVSAASTAAAAELFESVAIGIRGPGFVVLAADASFRRGLVSMSDGLDKIFEMDDRRLLCAIGDLAECEDFGELMRQTLHLHELRGFRPRGAHAAHFLRRELVGMRRGANRKLPGLKLMLATDDSLYWLDETGAQADLDFAAHGLGASLVLGHLDREYREDLSKEDALALLAQCFELLHERYASSTAAGFLVKLVSSSSSSTSSSSAKEKEKKKKENNNNNGPACERWRWTFLDEDNNGLVPLPPPLKETMDLTTYVR